MITSTLVIMLGGRYRSEPTRRDVPTISLADNPVTNLDELDLTGCVIGPDLVERLDGTVTLYRRNGHAVEFFGRFDGPASAFAALDRIYDPR
jgi:hypothetical protein